MRFISEKAAGSDNSQTSAQQVLCKITRAVVPRFFSSFFERRDDIPPTKNSPWLITATEMFPQRRAHRGSKPKKGGKKPKPFEGDNPPKH